MRRILFILIALVISVPALPVLAQEWSIEGNDYEIDRLRDQNRVIRDMRSAEETRARYMDRYGEQTPYYGSVGGNYNRRYRSNDFDFFGGGSNKNDLAHKTGKALGQFLERTINEPHRNEYRLPPEDRVLEGRVKKFVGGKGICEESRRGSGVGHCDNVPWEFSNGQPVGPIKGAY